MSVWNAILSAFQALIDWVGTFILALFEDGISKALDPEVAGVLNGLLPLVVIPVAISVIFFAVKAIKKISYGY